MARLIVYKLAREGFSAAHVQDGVDALAYLVQHQVDVLITELLLPGVDGFQLLRRLGLNEAKRPGICIVLSSRGGEEDVLEALKLGADDFIAKPFSMEVLAARVELALRNQNSHQIQNTKDTVELAVVASLPTDAEAGAKNTSGSSAGVETISEVS
jgi:two-component system, OmpR family, copper resistance phosphate regulon response regulator CusR